MVDLRNCILSKDFLAGLLFALIGAGLLFEARSYAMGSLLRMGPGFFPAIIGGLLALVGIGIIVKAILENARERPEFALGPTILITVALLAFALSLQRFGLVVATTLLIVLTRLAFRPFRPVGTLILTVVLVSLSVFVFVYMLRLPIRIWP